MKKCHSEFTALLVADNRRLQERVLEEYFRILSIGNKNFKRTRLQVGWNAVKPNNNNSFGLKPNLQLQLPSLI